MVNYLKTLEITYMLEKVIFKSRITEIDAVSIRMIIAYKKTTLSSDTHLVKNFAGLEAVSGRLTAAINRSKVESVLGAKDDVRDDKVRALFFMVMGYLHHPDPAVKAAAMKVEEAMGEYGLAITSESYAVESSLINSLLSDLAKPKLKDTIARLSGLAEIIAALQAAETDFEETRIAYEEEKAKEGTLENATTIKKEVVAIINDKLVVYLRATMQVDEPVYGNFARTVAQIIADNNEVVKKRRKKPAAGG